MASQHFILTKMLLFYLMPAFSQATQACVSDFGAGKCPETWRQWGDKCYKVTSSQPWSAAKQECYDMGSVMTTPNSKNETQFLLGLVSANRLWIDCNYIQSKEQWECKDGMRVIQYRGWTPGEPNGNLYEPCAEIVRESVSWNDNNCHISYHAVCKKPFPPMLHL